MKASQRRDDTGQPGAQRCPLSSQEWTFGNANKCPLWVISGHVHCKTSCPLYPRKRTCAVQLQMSALGQKRTFRHSLDHFIGSDDQRRRHGKAELAYGANSLDIFRRAGPYVERILRGAKPGDLPVQVPTKFEINLKTAKAPAAPYGR
jgi:hypothetical protein